MAMAPRLRKFALSAHLTCSVGWIGAVLAYLALGVAAVSSEDVQTVRASWTGMELTGWYVIVPLALASLLTGLVMALGTKWGLFRHYWVLISFALTALATVVLLLHMPDVSVMADLAQEAEGASLASLGGDLLHPGLGLVVLLLVQVLNVYKPPGLTRYGWRKQQEQRQKQEQRRKRVQRQKQEQQLEQPASAASLGRAESSPRAARVAQELLARLSSSEIGDDSTPRKSAPDVGLREAPDGIQSVQERVET